MQRLLALVCVASVVLGGCTRARTPQGAPASPSSVPTASASPTPQERGITNPEGVIVTNAGLEGSDRRIATAVKDLKRVRLWRRLTKHLYAAKFGSRPGRHQIPDDGHLADAFLTAQIEEDAGGPFCDIMFFPTAMRDDLDRWRTYYAQGLLDDPPPSLRQFWASIMAHELAHCLPGGKGEPAAQRWEQRALQAVRAARLE